MAACWNCRSELPSDANRQACPFCKASPTSVVVPIPEIVWFGLIALAAGIGYVLGGPMGAALGTYVGIPTGLMIVTVSHA